MLHLFTKIREVNPDPLNSKDCATQIDQLNGVVEAHVRFHGLTGLPDTQEY